MIIGEFIKCGTCNKNYRARIQVGIKQVQEFNFFCKQCHEPIRLSLNLGKGVILGDNCLPGPEEGATPQYLSDDIIANADEVNAEQSFPSLRFMGDVLDKIGLDKLRRANPKDRNFDLEGARAPNELWEGIKKIWRLKRSGQEAIWQPLMRKFAKENDYPSDFEGALFQFLGSMRQMDEHLIAEIQSIKNNHEQEFSRFVEYHHTQHSDVHFKAYFDLLGDYFDLFAEFSKSYLYAKFGTPVPEHPVTAAGNFNRVRKFYASAYEFYGTAIYILTSLNNIKSGRKFDVLNHIDLKKYLGIDKAKRRDNFIGNAAFADSSIEFDNGIRNASFHNWMRLSDDNLRVEYNAGGNGELVSITYAEYLYKCSTLFLQCCELLQVELILWMAYKYRKTPGLTGR